MNSLTGNKITIRGWFAQGLRIVIRHWPLFLVGALGILLIDLVLLLINPAFCRIPLLSSSNAMITWTTPLIIQLGILLLVAPLFLLGISYSASLAAEERAPRLVDFLLPFQRAIPVLGGLAYRFILVLCGFAALILPGVVLAVGLAFSPLQILRREGRLLTSANDEEIGLDAFWQVLALLLVLGLPTALGLPVALASFARDGSEMGIVGALLAASFADTIRLMVFGVAYASLRQRRNTEGCEEGQLSIQLSVQRDARSASGRRGMQIAAGLLSIVVAICSVEALRRLDDHLSVGLVREGAIDFPVYSSYAADGRLSLPSILTVAAFPEGDRVAVSTSQGLEIRSLPDYRLIAAAEGSWGESLCVSPCGSYIAAADWRHISLTDAETLEQIWIVEADREDTSISGTTALAFSPDSSTLLCGRRKTSAIEERSVSNGEVLRIVDVYALIDEEPFLGGRIRSYTLDWDPQSGLVLVNFVKPGGYPPRSVSMSALWCPATDEVVWAEYTSAYFTDRPNIIATQDNYVDTITGERFALDKEGSRPPFTPDWTRIWFEDLSLAFPCDCGIRIESLAQGGTAHEIKLCGQNVTARYPEFHLLGMRLSVPWRLLSTVKRLTDSDCVGNGHLFADDGKFLFSWCLDSIRLWRTSDGESLLDERYPAPIPELLFADAERACIGERYSRLGNKMGIAEIGASAIHTWLPGARAAAVNLEGTLCAFLHDDWTVTIWRIGEWQEPIRWYRAPSPDETREPCGISFLEDGSTVVAVVGSRIVQCSPWGWSTLIGSRLTNTAFALSERLLAEIDDERRLSLFSFESRSRQTITELEEDQQLLAVDTSGKYLAVGGGTQAITIYRANGDADRMIEPTMSVESLDGAEETCDLAVYEAVFLNQGQLLAVLGCAQDEPQMKTWRGNDAVWNRCVVVVWDTQTGEQVFVTPTGRFKQLQEWLGQSGFAVVEGADEILFFKIPGLGEDDAQDD